MVALCRALSRLPVTDERSQASCSLPSLVTAAVSERGYIYLQFALCIHANTLLTHVLLQL